MHVYDKPQVRALVGARVSVYKGEHKTSNVTQREGGKRHVQQRGWAIAGYFEDLDISASKYNPWQRPDLGPWLKPERLDTWDALVFAKVDRAFRSMKDAIDLAYFCEKHRKMLVFTDDGFTLDFMTDPNKVDITQSVINKFMLMAFAMAAEIEAKRIRGRTLQAHAHLRTTNRWAGGRPPYGYRIVKHPLNAGRTIEIDPETSEIVRRMADIVINGGSYGDAAAALNAETVPTPAEWFAATQQEDGGRRKAPVKGTWARQVVSLILRDPSCMGIKMQGQKAKKDRRPVLDPETAMPLVIAEPIFTPQRWNELQEACKARENVRERSYGGAPLLGILHCGGCERRLYRHQTYYTTASGEKTVYHYYRCIPDGDKPACKMSSQRDYKVQELLDALVAEQLADIPMVTRTFIPGEDHTEELDRIVKQQSEMRELWSAGVYDYDGGADEFKADMLKLAAQRRNLEKLPHRRAEWREHPTGETLADVYARMNEDQRRALLVESGVRLYLTPGYVVQGHFRVPNELKERVQRFTVAGEIEPGKVTA